jgi:tape measure domain-containing protein
MAKEIRVALVLDTSNFDRGIRRAETSLGSFERKGSAVASTLQGAFAAIIGVATIDQFVKMEGALTGLQNKLQVVAGSQEKANQAFGQIAGIADRTRSGLADVGDLYSKIALAGEKLGLTQSQVAQTTETFTKALKLTGAGAQQSSAAILQFGQALASGKLSGDEFRSLMENAPAFMRKLSDALGVSQGELRKLATEGALTSDVIIAATQQMAASVEDDFAKTTPTIADAFTVLKNNIMLMFDEINKGSGVFEYIRKLILLLADNIGVAFKFIGAMIAFALGAKAVAMVMNFVKALQVLRAATKAQTVAQAALLALGGPAGLAALAAGAAAAAGAYMLLDKAIPDSIKLPEGPGAVDLGAAPDARGLLEAAKAKATAEKEAEKAGKSAARLKEQEARKRAKELDDARDLIIAIENQTESVRRKIAVDLESVGLSERQRGLAEELRSVDEKRRAEIVKIQQLQRLTSTEQQDAIDEINRKYEEQTQAIIEGNEALAKRKFVTSEILSFVDTDLKNMRRYSDESKRIQAEAAAALLPTEEARRAYMERFDVAKKYSDQIFELELQRRASTDNLEKQQLSTRIANLKSLEKEEIAYLEKMQAARQASFEQQNTFINGFQKAMNGFTQTVNDNAAYGQRIFDTMTQGFTNSILKFVETGKLSFKDLFRSLMVEIIKMQANKFFLQLFGKGGVFGNLLPGIFGTRATGGPVMAGKPYVVGERGPELFVPSGPGTVVANDRLGGGGTTQVIYNINAVDAMSFKQMVARDPEFIYSVTQAGARRLPR